MKKLLKAVLFFFITFITSISALAGDAAMISALDGKKVCTASLDNSSWTPMLGETLPKRTVLEIGKESSVGLVHFKTAREYTLPADSHAVVLENGIESTASYTFVQCDALPEALDLADAHQQQVGAADPNNIPSPSHLYKTAQPKADASFKDSESRSQELTMAPSQAPSPQQNLSEESLQDGGASLEKVSKKAITHDNLIAIPLDGLCTSLGAPKQIMVEAASGGLTINSTTQVEILPTVAYGNTWLLLRFTFVPGSSAGTVILRGLPNKALSLDIAAIPQVPNSISGAARLELAKKPAYAAAIWISLLQEKMVSGSIAAAHLQRLAQQIETSLK